MTPVYAKSRKRSAAPLAPWESELAASWDALSDAVESCEDQRAIALLRKASKALEALGDAPGNGLCQWPGLSPVALVDFFNGIGGVRAQAIAVCYDAWSRGAPCDCGSLCQSGLRDVPGMWFVLESRDQADDRPEAMQLLCLALAGLACHDVVKPRRVRAQAMRLVRLIARAILPISQVARGSAYAVWAGARAGIDRSENQLSADPGGARAVPGQSGFEGKSSRSEISSGSKSSISSSSSSGSSRSSSSSSLSSKSSKRRSSSSKKRRSSGSMPPGPSLVGGRPWRMLGFGAFAEPRWEPVVVPVRLVAPRNILLIGMWPPSNQIITHYSEGRVEPIQGMAPSPYVGDLGDIKVHAFYPTFPNTPSDYGEGVGKFTVNYQAVVNDLAEVTARLRPAAIIVFTRGHTATLQGIGAGVAGEVDFLLEHRARNLLTDYAPHGIRGNLQELAVWISAFVDMPYVLPRLELYNAWSQNSWSDKFYFYISNDVIQPIPTLQVPPGAQPVFAELRQTALQPDKRLIRFPPPPNGGVVDGLSVIDPTNEVMQVRLTTLPWDDLVAAVGVSGFGLGKNMGYAGAYVSEYVNYMTLKYGAESMARPQREQCPYVGHVHVAKNLERAGRSVGAAQGVVTKMVDKIAEILRKNGYV